MLQITQTKTLEIETKTNQVSKLDIQLEGDLVRNLKFRLQIT